jgi:hypothetical protein
MPARGAATLRHVKVSPCGGCDREPTLDEVLQLLVLDGLQQAFGRGVEGEEVVIRTSSGRTCSMAFESFRVVRGVAADR